MHTDPKQPGSAAPEARRARWSWALASLIMASAGACSSSAPPASQTTTPGDCDGRAEVVSAGLTTVSAQGYSFTLSELEPRLPVQSDGPPGNHWTIAITDPDGAKVAKASLLLTTYMPDHGHAGRSAPAVETLDGSYDVAELVFPMPTLYTISLLLTLASGEKQTATILLCLDVASG